MTTNLVHYPDLLDPDYASSTLGLGHAQVQPIYHAGTGARHAFREGRQREVLEVTNLGADVLLILHHCVYHQRSLLDQFIGEGKWLHIQFCLGGSGSETLGSPAEQVRTSTGMCTITSYADATVISRDLGAAPVQKTACLYLRPRMLEKFFRVMPHMLPEQLRWMSGQSMRGVQHHSLRMHTSIHATVNDMLSCSFKSHARVAYMQAKSTELIAGMLHSMSETHERGNGCGRLCISDVNRISEAKRLIEEEDVARASLEEIAARVGLNRSKLAAGFRDTFGVSVQAYSRNLRLARARDLLRSEDLTVADVAERAGYSEVSSFTRAFTAHYSISPRKLRSSLATAARQLQAAADPILIGSTHQRGGRG